MLIPFFLCTFFSFFFSIVCLTCNTLLRSYLFDGFGKNNQFLSVESSCSLIYSFNEKFIVYISKYLWHSLNKRRCQTHLLGRCLRLTTNCSTMNSFIIFDTKDRWTERRWHIWLRFWEALFVTKFIRSFQILVECCASAAVHRWGRLWEWLKENLN